MNKLYNEYTKHLRQLADVMYASAVLQWDQETYMPEKGAEIRGQQLATLAGMAHELSTDKKFGELLQKLKDDVSLDTKQKRNIGLSLKDYNDRKKYSTEFVQKMTLTVAETFTAWQEAKNKNDYSIYAPKLEKLLQLKKEETQILGYKDHPYDALLDQYEPGLTTKEVEKVFEDVKQQLVPFVKEILKKTPPRDNFMYRHYDKDKQWNFGIDLLKQMGYDFATGRQDMSSHPFTIHFSPNDVRVTTRISEDNLHEMIWSTIHEGGHALYEQGIPVSEYGLPSGEAVSLGIHESQSRLWENNVGRSLIYWKGNFPKLQEIFPEQLKDVTAEEFYKAMNLVKPSLIRTNADELTYHLHILIRFEMEKEIMEGKVAVNELPQLWNKKYKHYLGVDVPDDAHGILQDIHWSHGSIGYFPTYSIGSFCAAQFFATAEKQIPGLEKEIESGNMKPLLEWLRRNIHQYGKQYSAQQLCERISGEKLNFGYFMEYAREKYGH